MKMLTKDHIFAFWARITQLLVCRAILAFPECTGVRRRSVGKESIMD